MQSGLMQQVKKNAMTNCSRASRHGVWNVTSAKATVITAAIAAFTMATRPANLILSRIRRSVYLPGEGSGTSVSPGTFMLSGENRPPSAIPPGSG